MTRADAEDLAKYVRDVAAADFDQGLEDAATLIHDLLNELDEAHAEISRLTDDPSRCVAWHGQAFAFDPDLEAPPAWWPKTPEEWSAIVGPIQSPTWSDFTERGDLA